MSEVDPAATFTCVATCQDCGAELFRKEGVTIDQRHDLIMDMPTLALCKERDHNTFPDAPMNYGANVEWFREKKARRGKVFKLIKEKAPPFKIDLPEEDE